MPRPSRDDTVAVEDLEILEEEKKLMEALEEEDRQQCQRQVAAEELERMEMQQSEVDNAWLEEMTEGEEARKYRDWGEWELQAAMKHPVGAPHGCQRVRVQGQVERAEAVYGVDDTPGPTGAAPDPDHCSE